MASADLQALGEHHCPDRVSPATVAIIVTQSCDLTHERLEGEPVVEVMLGRLSERASDASRRGNFTGGKHPRCLCLPIQNREGGESWIECLPWERVFFDRAALADGRPDPDRFILRADLAVLVHWLAQRYTRAALPDDFNNLLARTRRQRDQLHARLSPDVSALCVQLYPDRELAEGEHYSVNLLALVPVARKEKLEEVRQGVTALDTLMCSVGMDVRSAVKLENEVSYALVREFRHFPLEHLSWRGDPPDPMPMA
jgi:hypothetical protein